MSEISRPWAGTTVGDAGPYTAPNWWDVWQAMMGGSGSLNGVGNLGVIYSVPGRLAVSYLGPNFLSVDTGAAFVDGLYYVNSTAKPVTVTSATAGNVRDDRLVVRKYFSSSSQTARIVLLPGSEAAAPGPGTPPALTQDTARITYWDIPLARVSVADTGVITLTDEREFIHNAASGGMVLLSEYEVTDPAGEETITFDDIPQTYADLIVWYSARTTDNAIVGFLCCVINDDLEPNHYAYAYRSYYTNTAGFNYDHNFGDGTYMEIGAPASTVVITDPERFGTGHFQFIDYAAVGRQHAGYGKAMHPNLYHAYYEAWYDTKGGAPTSSNVGISKLLLYPSNSLAGHFRFTQGSVVRLYATTK